MSRDHQREPTSGLRGVISGRAVLTVLTVLVVLLAGCSGLTGGGDGGAGSAPVDDIPEGVDGVMYLDSGVTTDQTTKDLVNGMIEMGQEYNPNYDGPASYEEYIDQAEQESNLSIDDFQSMTVFYKYGSNGSPEEYAGAIIETDWTIEEMAAAGDGDLDEMETTEYQGTTIYVEENEFSDQTSWLADLGDGTYVGGTETVVKDVLDTRNGEMNAWSGELRNAYDNAADGYMKIATEIPQQGMDEGMQPGSSMLPDVSNIEQMTMVYHTSGSDMNMDAHMYMDSSTSAEQIKTTFDAAKANIDLIVGQQNSEVSSLVEGLSAEQDGAEVTISFTTTPDELLSALESYANQSMGDSGFGSSMGTIAG